jgi:hypothetical protein
MSGSLEATDSGSSFLNLAVQIHSQLKTIAPTLESCMIGALPSCLSSLGLDLKEKVQTRSCVMHPCNSPPWTALATYFKGHALYYM